MHANWCFQSKCSNISAEGLHFSAFHYYSIGSLFILRICVSIGGAISIRDPYICAVSRVCANELHAVFHGPVVCAVKT